MTQQRSLSVLAVIFGLTLAWIGTRLLLSPAAVRAFGNPANLWMAFVGQALLWLIAAAVLAIVIFWEKKPIASLWLQPFRWQSIAWGLALVALHYAVIFPFTEWVRHATGLPGFEQGMDRVMRFPVSYRITAFLTAGVVEELLFRGYSFERLISSIGLWPAQLIVALLFAVYHLRNGYPWQVAFTGSVIGSLMFGLVFARTRSVLAATGFHAAANWAREVVLADPPTMRTWFGPVAGRNWTDAERQTTAIVFNGVALVACALLYWSIRRRDRRLASDAGAGTGRKERALAK